MEPSTGKLSNGIYYLSAILYFGAVLLRSILTYRSGPELGIVLGLLAGWLILFFLQPVITSKWADFFPIYLLIETGLTFGLLLTPGSPDFFAVLLPVLSMQVMLNMNPKIGAGWIGVSGAILVLLLSRSYSLEEAVALSLIYTAANVLMGTYSLATRRANAARSYTQKLAWELEGANQKLQAYSAQLAHLAVARERNRLARELHDSVTQTVFSMTLSTQSAKILLQQDPSRVQEQLDHLDQLSRSALSEMQVLISELRPDTIAWQGLVPTLNHHLSSHQIPKDLSISLEIDGERTLEQAEEQALFRIIQEALNNIVKHAQADQASIRLHLEEPFWMEIRDNGKGFDFAQAQKRECSQEKVGLGSMRERASEIGWDFQIMSSPGQGARIRVEREFSKEKL